MRDAEIPFLARLRTASRIVRVVAVVMAGCAAGPATSADVHLAPLGDDGADGAAGRPVKTLRRALDRAGEIRAEAPGRDGPLVIEVADGRYELLAPLAIGPDDSGTEAAPTVVRAAAGARPVFSGGRVIGGWRVEQQTAGPRWTARLPEVAADGWNFGQLFVDGQRRFRPVVPAEGWFRIAASLPPSAASAGEGYDRFIAFADDLRPDWANLGAVELVAVHRWAMSRLPIGSIGPFQPSSGETAGSAAPAVAADRRLARVTLAGHTTALAEWCSFAKGSRYRAENVREALGTPGSWYLDRSTGTLTYCPLPGETPEGTVVVAPRLDSLLEITGDPAAGTLVEHVRLEGLTFAHGNWTLPPGGQSYCQADLTVGAAVTLRGCRQVGLDRVAVVHVGRYAVDLGSGCRDCSLERCELVDLGGGGVLVGTSGGPGSEPVPGRPTGGDVTGNVIRDCSILHGGRLHPAAVGIWIGHASHTTVEHCEIADLAYTGISVGWVWGYKPPRSSHNRIRRNHIHHLGSGVLSDLGGVYTLGVSPGTVVEGNVIHDVAGRDYGGWGLYTDEGSSGIVMCGNLVFRTTSGGFHQHYGRDNTIENNVFAAARDWQLERTRAEPHTGFTFRRNIVWWDSAAPLMRGNWTKGLVTAQNCYWNAGGPVSFPGQEDLAQRQAAGQDAGSLVADPGFADPAAGDFTLAADSPARGLGFVPLAPAAAGRRTPRALSVGLPAVPSPWPEARAAAGPP
jgi:hypothetical protein